MNILNATSQDDGQLNSKIRLWARKKKHLFIAGLIVFSCITAPPTWAGDSSLTRASLASIHPTGLSIYISPGGLHLGFGGYSYGRHYGRPHVHPFAKQYWKHQKRHHNRYSYGSSKRFGHRHGWKNERHRGKFRGKHSHRRHRH